MKAVVFSKYGPPDVLRLEEVEKPVPAKDEVLVKICAASVNDWDWALLRGFPFVNRMMFGLLKPKIRILGGDIAGRVEAVGEKVTQFRPGDEVFGDLCESGFGAFAEYVCARENALARKPPGMTFEQAAAIPQAAMLAVQGLIDVGQIQAHVAGKKKLLINGAGGGVGTFALQIARLHGVEVTAVDSSGKLDMLLSMGADHVIDYTQEDFSRNGRRYDLILDVKTNRPIFDYVRALNPKGIYCTVGGSMDRLVQALFLGPFIKVLHKKQIRIVALKPNKDLAYMSELFEAGKVVPVIGRTYPLSEVPDALRYFGEGHHHGKVVIATN